jgi:hypothetical protein
MTLDMLTQLGGSGAREAWDDGRIFLHSDYAFEFDVYQTVKVCKLSFLNQDLSSLSKQDLFLDRLKPSYIAHHDYLPEGEEGRLLRRNPLMPIFVRTSMNLCNLVFYTHLPEL